MENVQSGLHKLPVVIIIITIVFVVDMILNGYNRIFSFKKVYETSHHTRKEKVKVVNEIVSSNFTANNEQLEVRSVYMIVACIKKFLKGLEGKKP